jgi:hypothetical protein
MKKVSKIMFGFFAAVIIFGLNDLAQAKENQVFTSVSNTSQSTSATKSAIISNIRP